MKADILIIGAGISGATLASGAVKAKVCAGRI